MPSTVDYPSDENTFVVPPAWYRIRYPRKDGVSVVTRAPETTAVTRAEELLQEFRTTITRALTHPNTAPELTAAGQAYLAGETNAVGAAAVIAAIRNGLDWRRQDEEEVFADAWIIQHGIPFAVRAAAHLMALTHLDGNLPAQAVRYRKPLKKDLGIDYQQFLLVPGRVRTMLAAVSDEEYATAVTVLAKLRYTAYQRVATSFLAPTQTDWVEADCAMVAESGDKHLGLALLTAVRTPEQARRIADQVPRSAVPHITPVLSSFVEGLGSDALEFLIEWLDQEEYVENIRRLLSAIAVLPTDDAFQTLLDRVNSKHVRPALVEAAKRFPRRALRLLAEAGAQPLPGELLRVHARAHPELINEVLPSLSPAAAKRLYTIRKEKASIVEAPAKALPAPLVNPPWTKPRQTLRTQIAGLHCDDAPTIKWEPGERDDWRQKHQRYWKHDTDWALKAERLRAGQLTPYEEWTFFMEAPEPLARSLIHQWRPMDLLGSGALWLESVVARFELAALPVVLDVARRHPVCHAHLLMPFTGPEIALLMAQWARSKAVRSTALAWFARHPEAAARALIPLALGRTGAKRRHAEHALRTIAVGNTDAVLTAASSYGPRVEAAVQTLLGTDPLEMLPARIPKPPIWAQPALLPPVWLKNGAGALPKTAIQHLLVMLALSRLDEPYAGVAVVKEACEPESLAEFAWALFQQWQNAGTPSRERWAFDALGLLGNEQTVRRLTPLILSWPGEGSHARAVTGLEVLATIGGDVALAHLRDIAKNARYKGLREHAGRLLTEPID